MQILVVDDHELVRKGICSVLATEPTLTVCGEAADGEEAIRKATALRPDLVLMDISMPKVNGLEATRQIKRLLPQAEVLIVSQHDTPAIVRQALNAGARSYVMKSTISTDLLSAIAEVIRREPSTEVARRPETNTNFDPQEILDRSATFEKALRESEELFRQAMSNMAEGLYTVDAQGLVTYVNPSAEAMFGWTSAELLGKKMHDITHYKHPDGTPFPSSDCPGLQVLQKGIEVREHEDVFIRKDGSFFPVVFSSSPLKSGAETRGVVVCFRDDTKRRRAEETLLQSEQIYRAIGESIDYGVWICDSTGRNIYTSPSFLRLVGLTQQQCSQFGWAHALHPEDVEATMAAWRDCVQGGALWDREHRFRGADGHWHYVLARGIPIRDSTGKILYWAGITLDIQQRKETEKQMQFLVQTLETQVVERTKELETATDKLRELSGKLLQTQDEERRRIARELHDGVGQLLSALNMNLSKLNNEKDKLTLAARESLNENAALIKQAFQEIRTLSHLLHPPLLDEVGLESALHWYVEGFAERSKITVRTQLAEGFSEGLPRDLALALFRVVQECLTNVHRHSESPTALVAIGRASDGITLEVKDEGKGIASEVQLRISSGESSGVGLRGMRERIRQFGGRLEISSDQNGTSVIAVVPIRKQRTRAEDQSQDDDPAAEQKTDSSQATILCIDDEPDGLLPRKLLLESCGHRVIEARSGPEGIRLFQSEKIDAVILDYWMSGMKGTTVASELKRLDPAVPIIVLSGMGDLPGEAAGVVDKWIVKGSTRPQDLLDSIASLLERRSSPGA